MSTHETIYYADTECEKQRYVYQSLWNTLRWTYWWEIAANLKHTNLNVEDIDKALQSLIDAGKVEIATTRTGGNIWRVKL